MKIQIKKTSLLYIAQDIKDGLGKRYFGSTPTEALGDLVAGKARELGIEIEQVNADGSPIHVLQEQSRSSSKWPPLDRGTRVKTIEPNLKNRQSWISDAWIERQWGIEGSIVYHHDSHGLSYEVRHPDGSVGHYDPTELEVVK